MIGPGWHPNPLTRSMPKTKKPYSPKHIARIDSERNHTHCWVVRVQRRGQVVLQYFSDGVYGGKAKALKAARELRDELLRRMHDPDAVAWRRNVTRANNTSGVVGVGRYVSREIQDGRSIERAAWHAFWSDEQGRRVSRKFLVSAHGEQRARVLAMECRRQNTRTAVEAMFESGKSKR